MSTEKKYELNEIVWVTSENLLQEGKIVDTFNMNEKQYYIVQCPPEFSFLKFIWDTIFPAKPAMARG